MRLKFGQSIQARLVTKPNLTPVKFTNTILDFCQNWLGEHICPVRRLSYIHNNIFLVFTKPIMYLLTYLAPLKSDTKDKKEVITIPILPGTRSEGMKTEAAEVKQIIILGINV